jgi:HK97 gp10 family phage protein
VARRVNDSRLRRKLRRFPEVLRAEIALPMKLSAEELAGMIEANAPKDSGDMAEEVNYRLSRDGLSAQIGYSKSAGFKRAWNRGGFKALWQEFGTRNHPAQKFIRPSYTQLLGRILDRIDAAVRRTLARASSGDF